ncbi:MAG: hypothetical protein KGY54_11900 [Oleiphilaceae bacterium]|nr:hypothetical protein [Oleiphilaceae bacterium]
MARELDPNTIFSISNARLVGAVSSCKAKGHRAIEWYYDDIVRADRKESFDLITAPAWIDSLLGKYFQKLARVGDA